VITGEIIVHLLVIVQNNKIKWRSRVFVRETVRTKPHGFCTRVQMKIAAVDITALWIVLCRVSHELRSLLRESVPYVKNTSITQNTYVQS
jgi:hypothetical protein